MTGRFPIQSHRLLIDTGAYYAATDASEQRHTAAIATAEQIERERWRTFTTNFVLAETHALLLRRVGRHVAWQVLQRLERSQVVIVRVSAADERRAHTILGQYRDKDFSLTDATSFAVMERLRIGSAFTFDRNFTQYGFDVLPQPAMR